MVAILVFSCLLSTFGTAAGACDDRLQPFAGMRTKFFDGIEGGKPTSHLENKVFTISLGNGISVVMKQWKATRLYHLGFSLDIPGNSTATVTGLVPGATYRYALYQYTSKSDWLGHESSLSINGGMPFITSVTDSSDPTSTGTFVAEAAGTATFLFTRMGDMHVAFSGLSVTKACTRACDDRLQPFAGMRTKFFDGIEGGKATSHLENKVFTISLRNGISVVMKQWKATRLYHLGFSLNIPGESTATVTGLVPGATYRYALYQYTSSSDWLGHESSLSINGGAPFITRVTSSSDPTSAGTFIADAAGTATFLFTRMGDMHVAFSGLSVIKACTGGSLTTATTTTVAITAAAATTATTPPWLPVIVQSAASITLPTVFLVGLVAAIIMS